MLDADEATVVIEQQVSPEQTVGSLKQGLVCLPAGKIKAFQVRMPSAETLLKELRQRSVWISDQKILGVVKKLDVSVCTSWMGISSTKPKGKLSLEISWSPLLGRGGDATCVTSGKISLDGEDPRFSDKPMISAIAASLSDAVQCLERQTRG